MFRLVIYLFGMPCIGPDGESIQTSWSKVVALLAYLTATGTRHGCDSLATLLWPDRSHPLPAPT